MHCACCCGGQEEAGDCCVRPLPSDVPVADDVWLPEPPEQGFPSLTSTGTATLLGELADCNRIITLNFSGNTATVQHFILGNMATANHSKLWKHDNSDYVATFWVLATPGGMATEQHSMLWHMAIWRCCHTWKQSNKAYLETWQFSYVATFLLLATPGSMATEQHAMLGHIAIWRCCHTRKQSNNGYLETWRTVLPHFGRHLTRWLQNN